MKCGMRCTGSERGRKAPPVAGCTLAARQVEERCAVCVPLGEPRLTPVHQGLRQVEGRKVVGRRLKGSADGVHGRQGQHCARGSGPVRVNTATL